MDKEEEKEEITMEDIYEALKASAVINCFEKEFGPMPHPLRFFAFRRWWREFEAFQLGFELGQKYVQRMMEKQKENE